MATVVNNPSAPAESSNAMGMVIGLILLLAIVFLFFYYGLPALRQSASPGINVPSKIDVNVDTPQGGGQPAPPAQ